MPYEPVPDATTRFSSRVDHYVKHRPSYPPELWGFLRAEIGLSPEWIVADLGSGTGLFAELFLRHGHRVYGIEPNKDMREAGERYLAAYPAFESIDGAAEATGLEPRSIDLVTAGQAFHWFQPELTRDECRRIGKPGAWTVLAWNRRKREASPLQDGYDALMRQYGIDYAAIDHRHVDQGRLAAFFGAGNWREAALPNEQRLDWDGLYGRAMSSSYVPLEGHPNHAPFVEGLRRLFEKCAADGRVTLDYDARVYYGAVWGTPSAG